MPFDLIGDLHGHADPLRRLLAQLGYERRHGHWRQSESRRVVFLGDYIDRGPEIRATLGIVRELVDDGRAIALMGNHEFNALAFATADPAAAGEFCRRHTASNRHQHQATLDQMAGGDGKSWRSWLEWMRTLPICFTAPGLRAVHACWHAAHIAVLEGLAPFSDAAVIAASRRHSAEWTAVEAVLKGLEVPLPPAQAYIDKEGVHRTTGRVQWWRRPAPREPLGRCLMPPRDGIDGHLGDTLDAADLPVVEDHHPAVFFGHYWMHPEVAPVPLAPRVACLDYSVAGGGRLCAYRWDPERDAVALSAEGFVSVPAA